MAFTNEEKQEIRDIVNSVLDENTDPIEDAVEVSELSDDDVVPIMHTTGQTKSYAKAAVILFGGSGGGSGSVNGVKVGNSTYRPSSGSSGIVQIPTYEENAEPHKAPTAGEVKQALGVKSTTEGKFLKDTGEWDVPPSGGGGGGGITVDSQLSTESTNPVQNKVLTQAMNGKQATLVGSGDGQNIKTVNGQNILGSGNIQIDGGGGGGTSQGTKVYLAANGGSLTTAMLTSSNVVYVISYDYSINGTVIVPSGCTFEFAGGSISGDTLSLNNTYLYGNVKFGSNLTVTGICKNNVAYQKWFIDNNVDAWHRFINNVEGVSCFEYTFGSYSPTVYILKELDNKSYITINGNNATLNFAYQANAHAYEIRPKNYITYVESAISSAVAKGDTQVTVADGSLYSAGEVVCLRDNTDYSFSPHRDGYRQCEFAAITQVSGNTLKLSHPVYGTYRNLGGTSKVYSFNRISCSISDLVIGVSNQASVLSSFIGLCIFQSFGGEIRNVKATDYMIDIILYSCSDMMIIDCSSRVNLNATQSISAADSSYALSLSGCQNISVIGGDYVGGKHSLTIGGANNKLSVIDREILVKNIRSKTIRDDSPVSLDMHGCVEYITIEGCVTEGIYLRGRNNKILNNFIYGSQGISVGELCSYNHMIKGNIMKVPTITIASDISSSSSWTNANWVKDSTEENFIVSGNSSYDTEYIEESDERQYALRFFVTSSVSSSYYNRANTTLIIENNNIRNVVPYLNGFNSVIIKNNVFAYDECSSSGASSTPRIDCTRLFIEGNKFLNYGHKPSNVTWLYFWQIVAGFASIKDNYAESSMADYALFSTRGTISELYIEGNIAKSKFFASYKNHSIPKAVIRNNTLLDAIGVNITSKDAALKTDAIITDNVFSAAGSVTIQYAGKATYGRNLSYSTMTLVAPTITNSDTTTNLDA